MFSRTSMCVDIALGISLIGLVDRFEERTRCNGRGRNGIHTSTILLHCQRCLSGRLSYDISLMSTLEPSIGFSSQSRRFGML